MNTSSLMASVLPFKQTISKIPKPALLRFNKRFFLSSHSGMELLSSLSSSSKYDNFFPSYTEELIWPFLRDYYRVIRPNPKVKFPYVEREPEYDNNLSRVKPLPIERGKALDVISLLSTGGSDNLVRIGAKERNFDFVKAESLRSKYILVCCAFVPSLWVEHQAYYLRRLSLLLSELLQSHKGCDFETVMVSKMRKNWENDKGVFDHFFSAFSGCLAVPFEDKYRRDYICKSLKFNGKLSVILVDTEQKVLQVNFEWLIHCGAIGFPFTHEQLKRLKDECMNPWSHPHCWSLAGLLCCQSSNLISANIIYKFDSDEMISVEQLNKKLVGLYLCREGDKFRAFRDVYEQCRVKNLESEILVVCMPYSTSMDPKAFENDVVKRAMEEFKVSWWVFPYQNSACIRLSNMFFGYGDTQDSMIIVGPNNEFVDDQGGAVAFHFGVDAYPFTVKALVQTQFERLNAVTLESLLAYGSVDYVCRYYNCDGDGKKVPLADLKGKNVLVIFDCPICFQKFIGLLDKWYTEVDSDFEVVFVSLIYPDFASAMHDHLVREDLFAKAREGFSKMKCLVCPFHPEHAEFLYNHDAFLNGSEEGVPVKGLRRGSVITFGKDGHIHSLDAQPFLEDHGGPFLHGFGNLLDEICIGLCNEFHISVDDEITNGFDV